MPSIGQNVEFKIVETPKGNEAKDIKVIKSGTEAVQEQEIKAEETLSEEEQPKETPEVIEDLDQITGVGP
jgi:predicted flap endonuclease-1-like 5' DNA nuclease